MSGAQHGSMALMPAGYDRDGMSNHSDRPRPAATGGRIMDVGGAGHPGIAMAGAIHDLNDMLTVVLGSLEQLRRQPFDRRGQKQLDRAQWSTRQAGRLSRQALAAAQGADADASIVDLNEVVATFGDMMGQAVENGVGLAIEAALGPPRRGPVPISSRC